MEILIWLSRQCDHDIAIKSSALAATDEHWDRSQIHVMENVRDEMKFDLRDIPLIPSEEASTVHMHQAQLYGRIMRGSQRRVQKSVASLL
jgi:hypothetical protein